MILKMCLGNLKNFDEKKKKELPKNHIKVNKYELNTEQKNALNDLISLGDKV